ncbi:expressed unknown protein [Seminavis robusta]|uniref:Uncharacterized protein n=1 Tax=Seminavis robusta TaxID=568900 RepID=A0A9N8ES41_9STRA|nr:expressed unknown protein [Seminavis robusta]|eukprot:Sro1673_g290280.1 n/a (117) ;mRNA; r:17812-18575
MFLSIIRPASRFAVTNLAPRVVGGTSTSVRFFGLGDELKKKESVEEARYVREQEQKFLENKKAEKAAAAHEQELVVFEEVVAPAMVECQEVLKVSGDSVSDAGLEALAKWKLGMKK